MWLIPDRRIEHEMTRKGWGQVTRLARFAWAVLAYNLAVIAWGAYVRATGSGAGCGAHWPLCNGEVLPRGARVATLIEFSHRATSGLALLSVVALLIWTWRACRRGIRRAAAPRWPCSSC